MGPEWSTSTVSDPSLYYNPLCSDQSLIVLRTHSLSKQVLRDQTIPSVLIKPGATVRPVSRRLWSRTLIRNVLAITHYSVSTSLRLRLRSNLLSIILVSISIWFQRTEATFPSEPSFDFLQNLRRENEFPRNASNPRTNLSEFIYQYRVWTIKVDSVRFLCGRTATRWTIERGFRSRGKREKEHATLSESASEEGNSTSRKKVDRARGFLLDSPSELDLFFCNFRSSSSSISSSNQRQLSSRGYGSCSTAIGFSSCQTRAFPTLTSCPHSARRTLLLEDLMKISPLERDTRNTKKSLAVKDFKK